MEFVNPFNRKEHKDFIPVSVFPASKLTRTSLQIGRATPVYWIECIKNNHWEVSVSQLTRFMTMDKPVMNDFEVNFGAFYVPFVALDELTGSKVYLNHVPSDAQAVSSVALDARYFFNPASVDALRHSMHMWTFNDYIGSQSRIVGSLFDHLMYPIYDNVDIFNISGGIYNPNTRYFYQNASYSSGTFTPVGYGIVSLSDFIRFDSSVIVNAVNPTSAYSVRFDAVVDRSNSNAFMPFDLWLLLNPDFNTSVWKYIINTSYDIFSNGGYATAIGSASAGILGGILQDPSSFSSDKNVKLTQEYLNVLWLFTNEDLINSSNGQLHNWQFYFGKFTKEQVYDMYLNYVRRNVLFTTSFSSTEWSMYPTWTYLRIYGDYFLNPLITDKEQFFACCTGIYKEIAVNSLSLSGAIGTVMSGQFGNANLAFYFRYLSRSECLPVLWEKDYFTSAQIKEQQGNAVTIANGDSIPTLFYKRVFQKFKDLIGRMGPDYKTNSDALYGGNLPDNTLLRSQVIGFKKFKVSVGAIAQTSQNSSLGSLGEFAGYAYSNNEPEGKFEWDCQENGMIMILCWIRPLYTAISSAVPRFLIKKDYLDYFLPQFAGVGYQDIPEKLLNPASTQPNLKFAIQERYFEYYTMINECSGNFRDICRQYSVDRTIDTTIQLGETMSPEFLYITEADDINRIFTDSSSDPILASIYFDGVITRQAPSVIRTDF